LLKKPAPIFYGKTFQAPHVGTFDVNVPFEFGHFDVHDRRHVDFPLGQQPKRLFNCSNRFAINRNRFAQLGFCQYNDFHFQSVSFIPDKRFTSIAQIGHRTAFMVICAPISGTT